jgi:hypothetical protein
MATSSRTQTRRDSTISGRMPHQRYGTTKPYCASTVKVIVTHKRRIKKGLNRGIDLLLKSEAILSLASSQHGSITKNDESNCINRQFPARKQFPVVYQSLRLTGTVEMCTAKCANVPSLHRFVLRSSGLGNSVVLMPRRRFNVL